MSVPAMLRTKTFQELINAINYEATTTEAVAAMLREALPTLCTSASPGPERQYANDQEFTSTLMSLKRGNYENY